MKEGKKIDLLEFSEEQRLLRDTIQEFVAREVEGQALASDRREHFNLALFQKLAGLGVLGLTAPETYGGAGQDAVAAAIVHEELSASDPGFCLAYLAHTLLCVNNIAVNASEAQKNEFIPKLCTGEWIGAMAISEPDAGTDVLGMKTVAVRKGDKYIVNGRKLWITNGTRDEGDTPCDVLWLYAKTGVDQLGRAKISTFVVPKDVPGFSVGQKIKDKLGMRASNTAELCFNNCELPAEYLVGNEGESLIHMMRNLEIERLGLAAMGLGIAGRALQIMVRYANERKAFGEPLVRFGQIQHHIGESYAEYQAARSYVYLTARSMRLDSAGNRLDSDGAKLIAAQTAKRVADRAIQVLGGYGYVGECIVERLWRDAKLLEIGGGTLEAHEKNIAQDLARNGLSRG